MTNDDKEPDPRYANQAAHPLVDVPVRVLNVARQVLDDVDPLVADIVTSRLRAAGYLTWPEAPWTWRGKGIATVQQCSNEECTARFNIDDDDYAVIIDTEPNVNVNRRQRLICPACYRALRVSRAPTRDDLVLGLLAAVAEWYRNSEKNKSMLEYLVDEVIYPLVVDRTWRRDNHQTGDNG